METEENQATNLETMASRYVILTMTYASLKNPHLTRPEREHLEEQIHKLLDLPTNELHFVCDMLGEHAKSKMEPRADI